MDFDYEKGIPLPNGDSVKVISNNRLCDYYIYDSNGSLIETFELQKQPTGLTNRMSVGKSIFSRLPKDSSINEQNKLFLEIKQILQSFMEMYKELQEKILEEKKADEKAELRKRISSAMKGYERIDEFLIWLASKIEWLTAGERVNIMIAFLTFCSQVILRNPISLVGLGEGSSGKNHVSDIALLLIPDEYVISEKNPTVASMYRRSEVDKYYYDGKIVNYGDMGDDDDQDEAKATKKLLKELQTDGYLNKPVTAKIDGEFAVIDLELIGTPCLHYQTVPNYDFDDQELSRSILYTPRMDNRYEFNLMSTYLEFKGGKSYNEHIKTHDYLEENIPNVVRGLREKFTDITIVNPYFDVIIDFVGDNEYYKRDLNKYNSILKVITAFNSNGRTVHKINEQKIIFTNKYDVALFVTLFEQYNESIQANLSMKAVEILNDFKNNIDDWCYREDKDDTLEFDLGVSIARYQEIGNVNISKRSLQRYFKELNTKGYIQVVGTMNKANIYNLTKQEIHSIKSVQDLKQSTKKIIVEEYGEDVLEYIKDDNSNGKASILSQHEWIEKPKWQT